MASIDDRYERLLEAGFVLAADLSFPASLQRIVELARLSPQEERILAKLEVARRAEAAASLARHTTLPGSCATPRPHRPAPSPSGAAAERVDDRRPGVVAAAGHDHRGPADRVGTTTQERPKSWVTMSASMAAPQVAGSLALVASAHPSLRKRPGALISRLKRMANDGPTNRTRALSATDTSPGDLTGPPCVTGYCHLEGPRIPDREAYGAGLVNVAKP